MDVQTYNDIIKDEITNSGGTIIFVRDNLIIASEITEAEYRSLSNSPYIDRIDVVPLKRYTQ